MTTTSLIGKRKSLVRSSTEEFFNTWEPGQGSAVAEAPPPATGSTDFWETWDPSPAPKQEEPTRGSNLGFFDTWEPGGPKPEVQPSPGEHVATTAFRV